MKKNGVRIHNDSGEYEDASSFHEVVERLRAEQRYKRALMDIGAALLAGRVCDDVAWFDSVETLFDFVSRALEPDHTEPAPDMLGNFPISRDERRIIEWLRAKPNTEGTHYHTGYLAEAIERGEHRK